MGKLSLEKMLLEKHCGCSEILSNNIINLIYNLMRI